MDTATIEPNNLDHLLAILGAFVPLASALASFVNHRVRKNLEAGTEAPKALLAAGSILNVASVNIDKAMQLAKMLSASEQPKASPEPVCPTCGK